MDKYEVTNALYRACVDAGGCERPSYVPTYNNLARADHPVVNVDWESAKNYCLWRGAKLPTEAQWEKAARGGDGRKYPWGDNWGITYANYKSNDTVHFGSYPFVKSPYGVFDMAGNVYEWVSDWYSLDFYQAVLNNNISNPTGPLISPFPPSHANYGRVFRGGSWKSTNDLQLTTTYRPHADPNSYKDDLGFRCAKPVTP
jgi:formylglycine-generating enzyme required for sulfatase activity